jgi:hypothetical protein
LQALRLFRNPGFVPLFPMDRDTWIRAFIAEMERLRPHLRSGFGTNRALLTMATQAYRQADEAPKAAAQAAHQRMGPPPPRKP